MSTPKYIKYANAVYRLAEAHVIENEPRQGKYDDAVGEWLHDKAMEGWSAEELGDVQDFGHYDLLTFDLPVQVKDRTGDWTLMAAILGEDSQGFVVYRPFDSVAEAQDAWTKLEQEYAKFESSAE